MPKNIVICCDGTGNEVEGDLSNVLKLYRILKKTPEQRAFYDPGVGTIDRSDPWSRFKRNAKMVFGLATGAGLDDNVLDAYRFLSQVYEEGDRIYLFGFSRGAYTVRVLAGFLHVVGLLSPDQLNLAEYAFTAYKRTGETGRFEIAWDFSRIVSAKKVSIHFLGLWDTVSSVLVPGSAFPYFPRLLTLPHTRENPSVRAVRHAIAIDERRRMFRSNAWVASQPHVINPFSNPPKQVDQDVELVWFAGVHADIGGGYAEEESGLSKFPLAWMIDEAVTHGLSINEKTYRHLVLGEASAGGRHTYVPPDPAAKLHRSLKGAWWLLELLPKRTKWREWKRRSLLGYYLPRAEPRVVPENAELHPSVLVRMELCPDYKPINLSPEASKGRTA